MKSIIRNQTFRKSLIKNNSKKFILNDKLRTKNFISSDKINQIIWQAKKDVDEFIENSQNFTFEFCTGDEVTEICSGDAIL
jgi:hypothetical protein